jgi:DNA (cytosine-5)-methyltransferase 1
MDRESVVGEGSVIYGSICAGIEAATVAWHSLGWAPAWFAEIDPFARAVLTHRYPEVRNLGDFTAIRGHWLRRIETKPIDLLVGGTPCQSFSLAGDRLGLADPRGNLTLEFLRLAKRLRPRWLVWENVPGILSIDSGRTFGTVLGTLAELGYGIAYRILDAQFFGVPQRRRRVFVVGHLGGWQAAAAVLFERESLRRDLAPRKEDSHATDAAGSPPLRGDGVTGSRAIGFSCKDYGQDAIADLAPTLRGMPHHRSHANAGGQVAAVIFESRYVRNGRGAPDVVAPPLKAQSGTTGKGDGAPLVATWVAVRRLTTRECERLQGFPDDHTLIPNYRVKLRPEEVVEVAEYLRLPVSTVARWGVTPDGPRYKAIGNSMAVPVMRWIGARIDAVDEAIRSAA